jgi:pimeloyl-ACP methyl ester carboxylesterase
MVLIHGSWGDHWNWQPVVSGLSDNFRVLSYDRRGHSKSEKVATQGSGEEDARDASALLTRLKLAPAHVVGNSFGATIALKLTAINPSIFRSLIIHEPPLFDLLTDDDFQMAMEGRRRTQAVIEMLERGDKIGGARQFVETLAFGPGQWDKLPDQLKGIFIANSDTWLDQTRDPMGANVDLEALSQFRKPSLLSYGGKSPPFFKPIIEKLAKTIPGSKVLSYAEAGHTPHISHPDEFVRRVTSFAKELA